ncbi:MAG: DegT/DnrJ/EryC1/StrS family aminotransferase [Balneolaceae bacterium]|nr:DegT/DnrJ/EryC1/StrS family aminotransferase [Balneolaceae bacterium]
MRSEVGRNEKSSSNIRQSTESRQSKSGLPKAIIVVHLYGMPAKMDRILEIAGRYGVPVIEDAAEALGSTLNGKNCGNFGKFSVLSFNGNKIITTSGGGALLSDDAAKIQKARFLATQARDDAPHYQHSELGYNYRLSNISAGIGRGQMEVLDKRVAARRANHEFYFQNLGKTYWQPSTFNQQPSTSNPQPSTINHQPSTSNPQPATRNPKPSTFNLQPSTKPSPTGIYFLPEPSGYFSNRWLTTILVNPEETGGVTREDIRLALEEKSIECRPLWKPMHQQPLYEGCEYYGQGVSDFLFEYGLCLPSGSNLTDDERELVIGEIKSVLGE